MIPFLLFPSLLRTSAVVVDGPDLGVFVYRSTDSGVRYNGQEVGLQQASKGSDVDVVRFLGRETRRTGKHLEYLCHFRSLTLDIHPGVCTICFVHFQR